MVKGQSLIGFVFAWPTAPTAFPFTLQFPEVFRSALFQNFLRTSAACMGVNQDVWDRLLAMRALEHACTLLRGL